MTLSNRDQQILKRYLRRKARWEQEPEANTEPESDTPQPIPHPPASGNSRITKQGDTYTISNVTLYAPNGQPAETHQQVVLDATPITENNSIITKTQPHWLTHYQGTNKQLPCLPLVYAILEAVYDNQQETVAQELKTSLEADFSENWITTSTRINYEKGKVWHNVGTQKQRELPATIPGGNNYLEDLITQADWKAPLRALFMTQDVTKIPDVMGIYGTRKGRLWTPTSSREIERAAFVGFKGDLFYVDGCYDLYYLGRSRGVAPEAPARDILGGNQ